MLVLQRKKGETLLIGDNIRISVVEVSSDSVKLAVEAPKEVKILRGELEEAIIVNQESVMDKAHIDDVKRIIQRDIH
ncbi:carbon storage regulator CsrA [Muricomes intestini]|jgi:carbon storage regulator|uniref:Translational regulator CsrA n=2 Tax=Muricomes intestini TaxID=1796634 RepID=A0A4R3KHE9_9FIRM|nr:carbon storage regulator CsrA [Muricomes intestini]TCS82813.1 carbon storage regulator CsrA [Muricomes intestini]HAX52796.1 carbon storage regulator [Lachnospiraceae bacterium]HCR84253.1 carbon storage regulator [Lachnospiraceae bacterium]